MGSDSFFVLAAHPAALPQGFEVSHPTTYLTAVSLVGHVALSTTAVLDDEFVTP